ncbi:MAG TPA: hypothetical protein VIX19_19090 [Terriglobales bacterium]
MVEDSGRPTFLSITPTVVQPSRAVLRNRLARVLIAAITCLAISFPSRIVALEDAPVQISLGRSTVELNGPWKFHIGDNLRWSDPNFDDSSWETVDLTASPGAHDDDVGLTGYVPGWSARGHSGYSGYAWYRLRVTVQAPAGESLALAGPPAVDSAYQIFVDGKLLGSAGRFAGRSPTVFSIQPRMFALDRLPTSDGKDGKRTLLIAFRVWMGTWDLGDPSAGGIHIAPVIGEAGAIHARYLMQWQQTIAGYVVEVLEALVFILLGAMAWCLRSFDRANPAYLWLGAALLFTALYRANQAVFFWGQFETVHGFELISVVLLVPLYLASWTMAWRAWFRLPRTDWIRIVVALLLAVYIIAQFLSRSWFYGVFPVWLNRTAGLGITWSRLLFVVLTVVIAYRGTRQGRETWLAIPALLLVSVGLFAQELSQLGVKGIWFPFGTGVSRTQFAYAAFDVALFVLLWCRLQVFAERGRPSAAQAGV